jgi:hypothetical protein
MKYTLDSGRVIEIEDKAIRNLMDGCKCTKEEAIDIWLTDHDYIVNQEQEKLNKSAKNAGFRAQSGTKTSKKAHKTKVSAEKIVLFNTILRNLDRCEGVSAENISILKENKLISVKIGDKTFKIDVIGQRK